MKTLAASILTILRSPWLLFSPWAALLLFEVFRHLMRFSSGPRLNAINVADSPLKEMDWQPGKLETEIFYVLSLLLAVRIIQQKDIKTWTKLSLSVAVFLGAALLPLTVDFLFLHARPEPIFWGTLMQLVPLTLPFICCVWLASVTRNLFWFLVGMALAYPVASFLSMRADLTMDDAEQLQPDRWNLYLTQEFLASWTCGVGLAVATVVRLFAKSVRVGWVLGLIALVASFCILVGWSHAYPSLIYRDKSPIPIVSLQLPPDYFKPITWEPDNYGDYDLKGNYTQMAYTELSRIPMDDGPFPVIDSIQAKFVLASGQSFDLLPPQVTNYFEKTMADVFAQRYPGLAGGGKFPLFRFNHELREKLRGQIGTLVLAVNGRMVKLEKRAEVPLQQGRDERLSFPNGTAMVWQTKETNGSMRDWHWTGLHVSYRGCQPGSYGTVQMGEGRLLFVLCDVDRRQASMTHRKFYPDSEWSEPWYSGCHIDLSEVVWSIEPGRWAADDPEPQFLLPVDRLKLAVFEAKSWERFTSTITIPDFAIPVFPPDRSNAAW